MKKTKIAIAAGAMALMLVGGTVTALAASKYKNPAEVVAGITGKPVNEVVDQKVESGKTYGAMAAEAGKLDEFKKENLEVKKDNLNAQVASGKISQEKADTTIKAIEANQANCDGTGSAKIGQNSGAKFGSNGTGQGTGGANRGTGTGQGTGGANRGTGTGKGANGGGGRGLGSCVAQ